MRIEFAASREIHLQPIRDDKPERDVVRLSERSAGFRELTGPVEVFRVNIRVARGRLTCTNHQSS